MINNVQAEAYKAGFVGLIGMPNAGKSTLLNLLVKEKVSIVTEKPQTTRRRIIGFLNSESSQIVLVDTPGILNAKTGLNHFLQKEAEDVIATSDVLCAVLNLDENKKENLDKIIDLVKNSKKPWFAVITKVDLTEHLSRRQKLRQELSEKFKDLKILESSSSWKKDFDSFRDEFIFAAKMYLPASEAPLYEVDLFTPHTLREMTVEILREQCFLRLTKELPYQIAIRIVKFDESDKNITKIYAEILVAKESHKPIVIGKSGSNIKHIGTQARQEIEKLIDQKVYLNLEVVVKENWYENPRLMKELGYVVIKE